MIITIDGKAGTGKSSLGKALAKILNYRFFSVGGFRREMAKNRGISLAELNKLGENDPSTDREADEKIRELGQNQDNFVIEGRLTSHFIPHAINILLVADENVRIKRVFANKKIKTAENFSTLEQTRDEIRKRDKSDTIRYKKHYGIEDTEDPKNYDFILNSTKTTLEEAVEETLKFLRTKGILA